MKKTIYMLAFMAALAGCNSKPSDKSNAATTPPPPIEPTATAKGDSMSKAAGVMVQADTMCFQYNFKKDMSLVKLIVSGDDASGDYHWHPFEKDGGHGTFKGKKVGNLINADYTYTIEGSTQIESIVFKLDGDKLMKGEGELVEKGDKLVPKDASKLKFTDVYNKVDCSKMKLD